MRPRKKDKHLPACVYHRHGAFWLVKKGKWTRLGKTLPREYQKAVRKPHTPIAELIDDAMNTITGISKGTRDNYLTAASKLKEAFADFEPHQIQPADVWEFRDAYAETPNMTNRCLTLFTQIMNYAVRRRLIDANPVIGVDKHPEVQRDRLLTKDEYGAIYAKAGERLQCIMDLLYLTGQRVNDVLKIKRSALTDEGIYFQQQKTGKKILVQWTQELRAVVERAKKLNEIEAITLFQGRHRKAPDYRSVSLQWQQACEAAKVENAQLRDLRAMSLTETEDEGKNPTALAGHHSEAMTKRYLRKKKISLVEGPTFNTVQKLANKKA